VGRCWERGDMVQRRTLLKNGLGATAALIAQRVYGQSNDGTASPEAASAVAEPMTEELGRSLVTPLFIATWPFGKAACERSRAVLTQTNSLLDAVEQGINLTELDPTISSVGYGGWPNANGVVQLDACFMDGATHKAGSVAGLEGFPNPVSVARRVMEQTRHVMLVGDGAARFAHQQGFESRLMLTAEARRAWEKWRAEQPPKELPPDKNHDTIALLGLTPNGHLVGGCSTSGMAFKLAGRVGDSPLIGSGLYVDGQVGAAGATGIGENVLRYCATFLIVEGMRQGLTPTAACRAAIHRIAEGEKRRPEELSVNFVAINRAGHFGAAGTDAEFRCAVVDSQRSLLVQPELVR